MKNTTTPTLRTETVPTGFTPTQEQIDMLARRLMPEIKKFFADNIIQQEFNEWQAKNSSEKSGK